MSRQSKQLRKLLLAQEVSRNRKNGNKGPKRTEKKNRKVDAWYIRKDWLRKKPGLEGASDEDTKKKGRGKRHH